MSKNKKLCDACKRGDIKDVQKLLKKGVLTKPAKIDYINRNNKTPLIIATENNHEKIVKLILDSVVDVDKIKDSLFRSLKYATENGNSHNVDIILEFIKNKGIHITGFQDSIHTTGLQELLFNATKLNHIDIIRILIKHGAKVNDFKYTQPFYIAIENNNIEIIKLFLASKIQYDDVKNSRLFQNITQENKPIVKLILNSHIKIGYFTFRNILDSDDINLITLGIEQLELKGSDLFNFIDSYETYNDLFNSKKGAGFIEKILKKAIDVNDCGLSGNENPLFAAIKKRNQLQVEQLVKQGANGFSTVYDNEKYKKRQGIIYHLIENHDIEMLELIITSPSFKESSIFDSPLFFVLNKIKGDENISKEEYSIYEKILILLIENGSYLFYKDYSGSCFSIAAELPSDAVFNLMLEKADYSKLRFPDDKTDFIKNILRKQKFKIFKEIIDKDSTIVDSDNFVSYILNDAFIRKDNKMIGSFFKEFRKSIPDLNSQILEMSIINENYEIFELVLNAIENKREIDLSLVIASKYYHRYKGFSHDIVIDNVHLRSGTNYEDGKAETIEFYKKVPRYNEDNETYNRIINALLNASVDVNQYDYLGRTALHFMTNIGNLKLISLLLDKGSDIHITDKGGISPLQIAIFKSYNDVLELFVEKQLITKQEINKLSETSKPKEKVKTNMYVGHYTNRGATPNSTDKFEIECDYCDYWCEYEYDADWKRYFSQTPKQPFWFQAKGHIGMAACGECGTVYCENHSKDLNSMVCPECGSNAARKAIFDVLEKGKN